MGAYPDNSFEQLMQEIDQYGGANAAEFDAKAWTFITGLVRSMGKVVLANVVQKSYAYATMLVQESVAVSDVVAVDVSRDATDLVTQQPIAWIGKVSTIVTAGGTPRVAGIVIGAAAANGYAVVAVGGVIPRTLTGLASSVAGALVTADATTSRLRAWVNGDDGIGYASPTGNVLWFYAGRLAS